MNKKLSDSLIRRIFPTWLPRWNDSPRQRVCRESRDLCRPLPKSRERRREFWPNRSTSSAALHGTRTLPFQSNFHIHRALTDTLYIGFYFCLPARRQTIVRLFINSLIFDFICQSIANQWKLKSHFLVSGCWWVEEVELGRGKKRPVGGNELGSICILPFINIINR